jgi:hypothetical protein
MSVPDRGPEFVGVVGVFLALAIISVLGRCYTRVVIIKGFGLDDWFMVMALVLPQFA